MLAVFGRIFRTTKELWPFYLVVTISAVCVSLLQLTTPYLIKHATDTIVEAFNSTLSVSDASRVILWLALGLLAAELSATIIQNIGGWFGDVLSMRMRQILSNRYFAKLLSLPQSFYDKQVTGTIISRLDRSILALTDFVKSFANSFISMLMTIALVLVITAVYYWPLALLLAVIFPLYLYLTMLTSKKWMVWEKQKNQHIDTAQGRFAEVIGQMKVVKSFVTEIRELRLFQSHFASTISLTKSQSRWWHFMDVLRMGGLNLIFFAIYFTLFWRTLHGHFSIGDMVFLLQLVTMARQPAMMMSWMVDTAQRAAAGSREYFQVMDEIPESSAPRALVAASQPGGTMLIPLSPDADPEASPSLPSSGDCAAAGVDSADRGGSGAPTLEFNHITFEYNPGEPVIHDVSFAAQPNEKIAFVGESGGGKSTLVNLLLGLYDPTSGHLRVCGRDITSMAASDLRRSVGVVFQEPALFSGTIRENIAYAKPGATDEEIQRVARDAFAHDFIMAFNDGYDTVIGERGLRLSGGQKQRIAVARAMLKDAPILVLDEATSALDTKAERVVQAGLEKLMEGRTTIVIAHRLSTIADVDTIITLDRGRVDEIGSPAQLATSGGIYSELLRLTSSTSAADRKRLKAFGFHVDDSADESEDDSTGDSPNDEG